MARDWKDPTKVAELDESEATIEGMKKNLRIRKLTPYECGKLMGFDRSDFEKMYASGLSEVALYHSAGDSIVTTVLMGLFGSLLQLDYKKAIESVADRIANEKGKKE